MRFVTILFAACLAASGAAAQGEVFFSAERGQWIVANSAADCRAYNRPPEEINFAPYDALEIVAKPGFLIGVSVMFWPGAVMPDQDYELLLSFDRADPLSLPAKPAGDFVLRSEPTMNRELWKQLQTAERLHAGVSGHGELSLLFLLDDPAWLAKTLRDCLVLLPSP